MLNDKQMAQMIDPFVPGKMRTLDGAAVPSFGAGLDLGHIRGVDITLRKGSVVEVVERGEYLDPTDPNSRQIIPVEPNNLGHIVLYPGRLYLASSGEYFNIPLDVIGFCFGKSTYARDGLIPFMTPLEPGWKGVLTLEFAVTRPLRLIEGAGIAQVVFFVGSKTTDGYTGPYQNQATEAVGAMVGHDEIVVNWKFVPVGFDWVAVDNNGDKTAFSTEPFIDEDSGMWNVGDYADYIELLSENVTLPPSFDWTQTLRRRPQ